MTDDCIALPQWTMNRPPLPNRFRPSMPLYPGGVEPSTHLGCTNRSALEDVPDSRDVLRTPSTGGTCWPLYAYGSTVRPSGLSFRGENTLPVWLATLVRELPDGAAQAPPEMLSPITALNELLAVTQAIASGHATPHKGDRVSLKVDVERSLDSLGRASAALHATAINNFRSVVARADTLLRDVAGAHVLRAPRAALTHDLVSRRPSRRLS